MLVILGGPMSPNNDIEWLVAERELIRRLLDKNVPMFGACLGAQQIAKALGYKISDAPHKEVGWAPVYLRSQVIPGLPEKLTALHWHQEMFEIPDDSEWLFSSDLVPNQGFVRGNVIGLQFHFEPLADDVREIVVNDATYALDHNDLKQNPEDILNHGVPAENKDVMFMLLDYIVGK